MNKMNLREFAEVLVAMMNQQGTVCFLNNDNPAKQLAVAMSKGDACAYAPVAPLWDSYEKGADLNQMAAAVSMAMKEGLDKGSEMVKMNADRCAQQPAPSFKKHEAKETSDRFANMGKNHTAYSAEQNQGQSKAARKEFFPNTEEGRQKAMKMLQDIMGTLPDTMAASSGCSDNRFVSDSNGPCSGDCSCGNRCKPNRTYRPEPAKQGNDDYDPTDDLPENLRSQLREILKRIGLQPQNTQSKRFDSTDRDFVLQTAYPMLADDETIAAHPETLSRKVLDMNIVYCFHDNNNSVMNDGTRVLGKNCLERFDLKEEDVYNAAINNIVDSIVVGEAKDIIPNTFVNFVILSTEKYKYGAAAFLGADVLKNVADKMGESALMVMPVSEEFVAVFPASDTTSINGTVLKNVIKALKNLAPDEVLSNNVYLYDREHNLLAMESYQL